MHILHDILSKLQHNFSNTTQGKKRSIWFVYTLVSVIIPFTNSITSNLLRSIQTLFGLSIESQRYYAFMASNTLLWRALWKTLMSLIPNPKTAGRIILALDDSINPKTGKNIFGCGYFHDHAAKSNQSSYPWSQCIVVIGLLKVIKGRWAFLPLDFRYYLMKKDILAQSPSAYDGKKVVEFETKMVQAATMIKAIFDHYHLTPVLIVADSWFGNNGLWSLLERGRKGDFNILSRLRTNIIVYAQVVNPQNKKKGRGRNKKYGVRLGNVDECASQFRELAQVVSVFLYGQNRDVLYYTQIVMLKTLKCPVKVVWVFRKTRYVALFTTDLTLSTKEIIEYYGARWKIEAGFKEIKQEIGSAKSQTRHADSVKNHLHFCLMTTTLTWIYADKVEKTPNRKHQIKGRSSFAFSDVRRKISEVVLTPEFQSTFPTSAQTTIKYFVSQLLRMVA